MRIRFFVFVAMLMIGCNRPIDSSPNFLPPVAEPEPGVITGFCSAVYGHGRQDHDRIDCGAKHIGSPYNGQLWLDLTYTMPDGHIVHPENWRTLVKEVRMPNHRGGRRTWTFNVPPARLEVQRQAPNGALKASCVYVLDMIGDDDPDHREFVSRPLRVNLRK